MIKDIIKKTDNNIIHLVRVLTATLLFILIFITSIVILIERNNMGDFEKNAEYHMKAINTALSINDEIITTQKWLNEYQNNSGQGIYPGITITHRIGNVIDTLLDNSSLIQDMHEKYLDPDIHFIVDRVRNETQLAVQQYRDLISIDTENIDIDAELISAISEPLLGSYHQLLKIHQIKLLEDEEKSLPTKNMLLVTLISLVFASLVFGYAVIYRITSKIESELVKKRALFKSLQTSNDKFNLLLQSTNENIFGVDENGNCTFANKACAKTLGLPGPLALTGRKMHDLMHTHESCNPSSCNLNFSSQGSHHIHTDSETITLQNGNAIDIEVWIDPIIKNEKRTGSVITFIDITDRKQDEKRIASEKAKLQSILNAIPDTVIFIDTNKHIIAANQAIELLFGYSAEEMLNQSPDKLLANPACNHFLYNSLNDAEIMRPHLIEYRHKNGNTFTGETLETKVSGTGNNPVGFIAVIRDVTERIASEKALNTFKSTLDMTLDCVFTFDPETLKFNYVNQGAINQVGYSRIELLNMTPINLNPTFTEHSFRKMISPLLQSKVNSLNYETLHRHKDGHDVHVEVSLQLVKPSTDSPRFIAMVRDITERRAIERELKTYQLHLEKLVKERTKRLEEANDELLRKERLATLGQLTATVSHELRNPLGAMRPSLFIIKRKNKDTNDIGLQQAIDRVDRNISRCDRIIDELLDFTRNTQLERSTLILDEWLSLLIEEYATPPNIQIRKKLRAKNATVYIDPYKMRRAVINILDNAVHATQSTLGNNKTKFGMITITTEVNHNRAEISVIDSGPGISDEILCRIYEPLYSTKSFGVGLGMTIVKQIVDQHNGDIEIKSHHQRGATISLQFPTGMDVGVQNSVHIQNT